jgi:translation initiation factor IF-2
MTDTKNPNDKTLSVPTKTLSLKRPVEQGVVRQSFSHGRSKAVVVETVKRRTLPPAGAPVKDAPVTVAPRPPAPPAPVPAAPAPTVPSAAPAAVVPQAPRPPAVPAAAAPVPDSVPRPAPVAAAPKAAAPARPAASAPQPGPSATLSRGPERNAPAAPPARPPAGSSGRSGMVLRSLSDEEMDARARALADARVREADDRRRAVEESRLRAERDERDRVEREQAEARKREEDERRRQEDDRKRRAEQEAARRLGPSESRGPVGPRPSMPSGSPRPGGPAGAPRPASADGAPRRPMGPGAGPGAAPGAPGRRPGEGEDVARPVRRPGPMSIPKPVVPAKPEKPKAGEEKRRGRLTVTTATEDEGERTRSVAAYRRRMQRMMGKGNAEQKEKIVREVVIPETISIQELANRMSERAVDVIRLLMKQGQMLKINDVIDADTAQLIAEELGHSVKRVADADVEEGLFDTPDEEGALLYRPPVVTIMGHVDHGKTSLLDAIRKTNVVSGEAGGITQHIGAYQIVSPLGGKITFIDTPGHAAFTAMRARGAKITDIVVLVVAADDGVMPQTAEAIAHARAAKVPLIVAINKMDKPDANPQRVRTELLSHEIVVESLGGDTLEFEISAKTGLNLDKLLEGLQLQAEILDLKSDPARSAEGTVIEAKLDRGRGPVATVLVQRGTLRPGDIVVAGSEWGKVRALISDLGQPITEAGPSVPVEVLGFNGTPEAGDRVAVVESEARAREITDYRTRQKRERSAARVSTAGRSLSDMMRDLKSGAGRKEFLLVVKGDVQGSVEAIVGALEKLGNDEVIARVIHSGVGGITESDLTLASASGAAVIGFNVRAHKEAREAAERTGTEIRYYNIIYDLVDDVKAAMSGLLAPTLREERLGEAQILEIFNITKVGKIAGCRVMDGVVQRGAHVRLIRDNVVIHEGRLSQLKRFKDDAREVTAGQECGMSFETYQDMRAGDVIECYRLEEVRRTL